MVNGGSPVIDNSYKLFGGYNFGLVPMFDLAAELSYVDFGKHAGEYDGDEPGIVEVETTGLMASGLGAFNMGPFAMFAKVGFVNWDSDLKALGDTDDNSGNDAAYGLGARFQFGSLAVRAEYELFDLDGADLTYTSIGASYTF